MPVPKIDLSRSASRDLNIPSNPSSAQAIVNGGRKNTTSTNIIQFPADLNDIFMSFKFYDYRDIKQSAYRNPNTNQPVELTRQLYNANKDNVNAAIAKKNPLAHVYLPIPASLVDSFRVDYQTTSLGLVGGIAAKAMQGVQGAIDANGGIVYSNLKHEDAGAIRGDSGLINKGLLALQNDTVAQGATRAMLMGAGQELQDLFDLSTGVSANPNLAMLFKGPTLKQHTFQWRMSARNAGESASIQRLIATFKRAMHPTQLNSSTSLFLKYPSEVLPEFHGPGGSFLYPMRPCVVEDFTIDYGPNGVPTFFQDGKPTTINVTVRLQETSYYTRESFYANSGEYGSDGLNDGAVQEQLDKLDRGN